MIDLKISEEEQNKAENDNQAKASLEVDEANPFESITLDDL